jgi:hypothetical protein
LLADVERADVEVLLCADVAMVVDGGVVAEETLDVPGAMVGSV